MLGRSSSEPTLFQMVDVEGLVPKDHRLRKIDAVLDLSFVSEAVGDCYPRSSNSMSHSSRRLTPYLDTNMPRCHTVVSWRRRTTPSNRSAS
jgi:hypothetical protein